MVLIILVGTLTLEGTNFIGYSKCLNGWFKSDFNYCNLRSIANLADNTNNVRNSQWLEHCDSSAKVVGSIPREHTYCQKNV